MNIMFSQVEKVETALLNGEELTAAQIASRYQAGSPRKVVSLVRQRGNAVYLNTRTDGSGRTTRKYRIGTPSASIVAAGYRALALGL
jgi:hypothetical protein